MAVISGHLLSLYLRGLRPPRVENPGKSQTKEGPVSQADLLSMLKGPICISMLSSLYVEVTPSVPGAPENARVSETLQQGVNGAWGQGLA